MAYHLLVSSVATAAASAPSSPTLALLPSRSLLLSSSISYSWHPIRPSRSNKNERGASHCSQILPLNTRLASSAAYSQVDTVETSAGFELNSKSSLIKDIQHRLLVERSATSVQILSEFFEIMDAADDALGCMLQKVPKEHLLREAESLDCKIATLPSSPPPSLSSSPLRTLASSFGLPVLSSIPLAIKDNICAKGTVTTGGSNIISSFCAPYDASAASLLRESGCSFLSKANLDEWGMGSSTENSAFKITRNPWDLSFVPGGSSGGCAAAVASMACAGALGTDTGGSIRQPAAFCGVVGLKPSYGRVSRFGLLSYASSLDCIGPIARCVEDAALLLSVISGHDKMDATSAMKPVDDYLSDLLPPSSFSSTPLQGLRLGVVRETLGEGERQSGEEGEGVREEVREGLRAAIAHLESLGATIVEVSLPSFSVALPAYYVIATSEASSNLARYDGVRYGNRDLSSPSLSSMYSDSRGKGMGREAKRRILMGTFALSSGFYDAYYKKAQQVRSLVLSDFLSAFSQCDFLITPTAPSTAYKIGEKMNDPLAMYLGDLMTVSVNLAGLPALSLPCAYFRHRQGERDGEKEREGGESFVGGIKRKASVLPIGLQFIAPHFQERGLLRLSHIFEQTLPLKIIERPS